MGSNMVGVTIIKEGKGNQGKWVDFQILGEMHRAYLNLRKVKTGGTGEVRTFTEFDLVYDLNPVDLFSTEKDELIN